MALVREFGQGLSVTGSSYVISIANEIPAGSTLVISGVAVFSGEIAPVVTDTSDNTWTVVGSINSVATQSTKVFQVYCVVEETLTISDTISVSVGRASTRNAYSVLEFDTELNPSGSPEYINPGSTTNLNSTSVSCPDNSVLIGSVGMVNPGRIISATSPTVAYDKKVSSVGSGERAVWVGVREISSAGEYGLVMGTTTNGSSASIATLFVEPDGGGTAPPGWTEVNLSTWTGSSWTQPTQSGFSVIEFVGAP